MNIKQRIGQRIQEERLAKGLTRKALEELTDDLKQSRISNWERGDRTPGPEEIKQLAKALEVSPAYLMCLTDERQTSKTQSLGMLIPILTLEQACTPDIFMQEIKKGHPIEKIKFIPVSAELGQHFNENAFAIEIKDDSMHPELRINDILVVNTHSKYRPGSLVAVKLPQESEIIIRRYKQLALSPHFISFELHAENENWGTIKIDDKEQCVIVGVIEGFIRTFN